MPYYMTTPQFGWGARDVKGPLTRSQVRSMAALMLAQGLPASSPGPSLKTLYSMKGDPIMPHTVPAFGYPVVGHYPPLYPPEGGVYTYSPTGGRMHGTPQPVDNSLPARNVRMMQARHTPRRGGLRPFHRRIRADIDFDADFEISGMQGTAPMITLTGDFDPMDPVMGSFLSNIAHSVSRAVSSVAKTVAKVPGVKIALAPIKAVTHPAATVRAVATAVTHPGATLKSIPGRMVQEAKETLQAANQLRQSGIVKAGIAGLSIAIPAVGIPAAAALALTQKVVDNAKSLNPIVSAAAKAVIVGTAQQAKTGDPNAKRAIALMAAHGKSAASSPRVQEFHFRVTEQGRIQRLA